MGWPRADIVFRTAGKREKFERARTRNTHTVVHLTLVRPAAAAARANPSSAAVVPVARTLLTAATSFAPVVCRRFCPEDWCRVSPRPSRLPRARARADNLRTSHEHIYTVSRRRMNTHARNIPPVSPRRLVVCFRATKVIENARSAKKTAAAHPPSPADHRENPVRLVVVVRLAATTHGRRRSGTRVSTCTFIFVRNTLRDDGRRVRKRFPYVFLYGRVRRRDGRAEIRDNTGGARDRRSRACVPFYISFPPIFEPRPTGPAGESTNVVLADVDRSHGDTYNV